VTATPTEIAPPPPRRKVNILFGLTLIGLLLFLWLMLGIFTASFWTPLNISNLLRQGSMTAILALGQTFDTREEALAAVQHISHWKIAELSAIDPESRYNVDFRFRLDVSQLPRPFQIGAVGHADWNISALRNQRLAVESAK